MTSQTGSQEYLHQWYFYFYMLWCTDMKTPSELKAHYRDVIIPMVAQYNFDNGSDAKPWECVRVAGRDEVFLKHPTFTLPTEDYTFALTILESRPVFVGDKVYWTSGHLYDWKLDNPITNFAETEFTWTPPAKKRTFVLNGVEYNCPTKDGELLGCRLDFLGVDYYFDTVRDRNNVASAINNMLREARDKE